jgi:transcriptional regulator with XRE-family HTH domain
MNQKQPSENRIYNPWQDLANGTSWMPKATNNALENFGERLATLRKEAGYTQTELGDAIGVTQRVVAYYEGETKHPPVSLLPSLAKVLNVTTDELLGVKSIKTKKGKQPDNRLQRRLQQVEKLSAAKRKQVIQVIDTFIEAEQLKA